jgi:hypothetical protein
MDHASPISGYLFVSLLSCVHPNFGSQEQTVVTYFFHRKAPDALATAEKLAQDKLRKN